MGVAVFSVVLCLAQPEDVSQAKPGQVDGFMMALAWPGVLKCQSQAVKLWLFARISGISMVRAKVKYAIIRLFWHGGQI